MGSSGHNRVEQTCCEIYIQVFRCYAKRVNKRTFLKVTHFWGVGGEGGWTGFVKHDSLYLDLCLKQTKAQELYLLFWNKNVLCIL